MIRAHFESIYDRLIETLGKARHSVRLSVAWMNPELFSDAIDNLLDRGVQIAIAYYNVLANRRLKPYFHGRRINFYPVTPRWYGAYMHHKFCIIDDEVLITGSYNWTKNAARGFENVIIAEHEFELVKQYKHEFEDIKAFVNGDDTRQSKLCFEHPHCRSEAYHLAVFYPNDGNAPMATGIWQVCERHRHAKLVRSEPYTADDEFEVEREDFDEPTDRADSIEARQAKMLREFATQRESIEFIKGATAKRFGMPIDAYGSVRMKDEALHSKSGGSGFVFPEYEIVVQWRDVYYRKTVPESLSADDGYGRVIRGKEWTW
ncbi:phospholipase D-like domain-containing protein [Paraburkholderia sp. RL17-347-BIC-D]|uniref:phospholipase D-like domain-containing protein n=1 Tax=Paraburkholderia sp. RL17-347-BIC-D TaxID=3031632 RepID=UPI0038B79078